MCFIFYLLMWIYLQAAFGILYRPKKGVPKSTVFFGVLLPHNIFLREREIMMIIFSFDAIASYVCYLNVIKI